MSVIEQVREALISEIRRAAVSSGVVEEAQLPDFALETPREKAHGDYSTNIAMQLTKIARQNPRQIAERIVSEIKQAEVYVERIDIAGPGFINFYMDKKFLYGVISQIAEQGDRYGGAYRSAAANGFRWNSSVPTLPAVSILDMLAVRHSAIRCAIRCSSPGLM